MEAAVTVDWTADHTGGALKPVLDYVIETQQGQQSSYGADTITAKALEKLRDEFQVGSEVKLEALFLSTGTASNALALACLVQPFGMVFCANAAHIETSECGAPEFYMGGGKLRLVPTDDGGKMILSELENVVRDAFKDPKFPHQVKPCAISLTQPTESGVCYSIEELETVSRLAKTYGLHVHMDGARFGNAMVALGVSSAAMSWRVGVDALSFGTTKNGTLCTEVLIFFGREGDLGFENRVAEARYRQKRGGLLLEKSRFLSAQIIGYLGDGAWSRAACNANAMATYLGESLKEVSGVLVTRPIATNMVYLSMPRIYFDNCISKGHKLSLTAGSSAARGKPTDLSYVNFRICTQWSTSKAQVDSLVAAITELRV